ncbi:methyltransferase [Polymorphobacter glacialis]|uniref:Methyltransferase n=1 Tax=Sandarakinorhabdus glacialis TaxID=1614636 RepID=A0A916ZMK0_9SPHN|nr:methyltransferase domain-containing protein [Polymorphobacter glacialis]GGE05021.1 methyltransferase [Polymorphobacter glacialis]
MSNAAQIEYWNSRVGDTWAGMQARIDESFTPVTAALLSLAAPQPGENALDVGCGSGETTLALAGAVGDDGTALGIDISDQLLARARERAAELLSEAEFRQADAATFDEDSGFDLIVSRFGVMFFADPVAALANIRALAALGGRLVFACWQPTTENLWATLAMQAVGNILPDAPMPPIAGEPGPFAFADPEHVHGILDAAGWQDIAFHALSFSMVIGAGEDALMSAVEFHLSIGPAARAIREAGPDVAAAAAPLLADALRANLFEGVVGLPAAAWIVTARA